MRRPLLLASLLLAGCATTAPDPLIAPPPETAPQQAAVVAGDAHGHEQGGGHEADLLGDLVEHVGHVDGAHRLADGDIADENGPEIALRPARHFRIHVGFKRTCAGPSAS